jgi:PLP dependent protein
MLTVPHFLAAALPKVRARIQEAELAAGRAPGSVTLVAVTKGHDAAAVAAARAAGLADFGENYVQEALAKLASLPREGLTWHFIGQLQTNKTRPVAEHFDWVHSVDRLKVAERLSAQRPAHGPRLSLCLEVALTPEPDKGGVDPLELDALADAIAKLPRVALRGLMCVPPEHGTPAQRRAEFAELARMKDRLNARGHALDALSMGMSQDFELAIEEGATHVRLGTALFGPRPRKVVAS